ncbi:DUF5085 family protein [Rossellomorea marisflavi]|uniref:DUF5085 family protein n=1 Tax=Rossellomorea marisflavi TaxID=189381 RepID=UPI00345A7C6C
MLFTDHTLTYMNVASKLYRFAPEELEMAFEDFAGILENNGYNPTGDLFFCIISNPLEDEIMTAEIFLPIEEDRIDLPESENVHFRSYFYLKDMVMSRVMENFDEFSQYTFWEIVECIERSNQTQSTPMFVVYKQSPSGKTYVEMSAGAE